MMALLHMGKLRHGVGLGSAFVSLFDGLPFATGIPKQWEFEVFKLSIRALWLYFLMMSLLL